jgi:hypothetical protein
MRIDASPFQCPAKVVIRMTLAIGAGLTEVRCSAGRHQHCEAAIRETERAETPCVQMIVWGPFVEHVRDEPPKLGWASPELQDLALVIVGVPWWLTAATTKPAWAKARVVS